VGALFSSEVSFTQEMVLWEDGVAKSIDIRNEPDHATPEAGETYTQLAPVFSEADR
jgi:hypothetical protein